MRTLPRRAAAKHRTPVCATAALLLASLLPAQAQTTLHTRTTTFVVSVTVDNDCQISGATALDFGHIHAALGGDVAGQAAPAQQYGRFNVSCSRNTRYTLYLDRGNVPGSSVAARLMAGSTPGNNDRLLYQLYRDPAFSTVWGDGSEGGTDGLGGIGTGADQSFTVYGRILPQQLPAADLYSSIITASLTF